MAQRKRHLLFTTEPARPIATDDIFPRGAEPSTIRLLWLGLTMVLAFLAVILLLWGNGGI